MFSGNINYYKICIVGLGYVGLPLAIAFSEQFQVVGYDIDDIRVKELVGGKDKTLEINEFSIVEEITQVNDMANIVFQKIRKKYITVKFLCVIEKYVRRIASATMGVINYCHFHFKNSLKSESAFISRFLRFSFLTNSLTASSVAFTLSIRSLRKSTNC